MTNRDFKIWCSIFFTTSFVVIFSMAATIFFIDPLWQWNHPFHLKTYHPSFNERAQKTNYLASRSHDIDTLIVGSSRSSYINPEEFGSRYGFNYAVSSGTVSEFPKYIEYVRRNSHLPLKFIAIESSFFHALSVKHTFNQPDFYIEEAENALKKYKRLANKDVFLRSLKVKFHPVRSYYFAEKDKFTTYRYSVPDDAVIKNKSQMITEQLSIYKEQTYNNKFDEQYRKYLRDIHKAIESSDYVVYTTPVSKYLLRLLVDMGQLDNYERWLRELVDEFGTVYNFMYPNNITMDDECFYDAHHHTSITSSRIVGIMKDKKAKEKFKDLDWVAIIDKDNIDRILPILRKRFDELR